MGFEKLSGEFNRGYTKAIQDIMTNYDRCEEDLKIGKKRMTTKLIKEFFQCFLENRAIMREDWTAFIFYNLKEQRFKCGNDKRYNEEGNLN